MISMAMVSMIGGALTGFLFKFAAEKRKEQSHLLELALKRDKALDDSRDRAHKRTPGAWVRRGLALAAVTGVIIFPFVTALLGIDTVVQHIEPASSWLFGLINIPQETVFENVKGFVMVPELRDMLAAIVGYYMGSSSAAR